MSRLSQFNVEVTASMANPKPGPTSIALDDSDVRFNAPGDYEVLSIDPNRFNIQVERRVRNVVPVRVVLTGEPAAGASAGLPTARPGQAQISGPESKVAAISYLVVEVSLDGHARSFAESVTARSPDPLVQVLQPNLVNVEVPMTEPELSISINDLDSRDGSGKNGPSSESHSQGEPP
jgi:YbbR domain-containing protein